MALVMFENPDLSSSHFGKRTALRVGPGCTYKTPVECVGRHLNDLPQSTAIRRQLLPGGRFGRCQMSDRNEFKTSGNVGQRTAGTRESNVSDKRDIFRLIRGQEAAKRAALIALAGGHSILFYGPPGWGKTMLCNAIVVANTESKKYRNDIAVVSNEFRVMRGTDAEVQNQERFYNLTQVTDIHVEVPPVHFREFFGKSSGTSIADIERQLKSRGMNIHLDLSDDCLELCKTATDALSLNGRALNAIVRVSRTIANPSNSLDIDSSHIAEAIQYHADRGTK